VFVASHHGRESGYCKEVFDFCQPQVAIISDESIRYDTQEHCYDDHCSGIAWGTGRKKVFTTRSNGMISISAGAQGCTIDCVDK
jgi:beta-lactamase superfamily II metal-dependent hydrolase